MLRTIVKDKRINFVGDANFVFFNQTINITISFEKMLIFKRFCWGRLVGGAPTISLNLIGLTEIFGSQINKNYEIFKINRDKEINRQNFVLPPIKFIR